MRACFFWTPVGLEPARGRALSGRAASVASRRGRRQATEAGAYLRSKYADVPPPRTTTKQLIWDGVKRPPRSPRKLRWNSSCFGRLPAHLGTISPQLICQLPHFSMEKRGCLPHYSMEKRGLLPLFPRETLGRPNLYRLKDCPKLPAGKERPQVPAVELRWNRDCLVPKGRF